jgi:hypothetical protein
MDHPEPHRPTLKPRRTDGVQLQARSIKLTLVLDPPAVAAALEPFATTEQRIPVTVSVEGRRLTADFPPRAVRRALATITEHGSDGVTCLIQGKLLADNSIGDAGLLAQPKARPTP